MAFICEALISVNVARYCKLAEFNSKRFCHFQPEIAMRTLSKHTAIDLWVWLLKTPEAECIGQPINRRGHCVFTCNHQSGYMAFKTIESSLTVTKLHSYSQDNLITVCRLYNL